MYWRRVGETELTGTVGDFAFNRITLDDPPNDDLSFLATLRAIMYDRIGDDCIKGFYAERQVEKYDIFWQLVESKYIVEKYNYMIFRIEHVSKKYETFAEIVNKVDANKADGFERLYAAEAYYQNKYNATCFINREKKISVILVFDTMNMERWRTLQLSVPSSMPWYFANGNKVTESERRLFEAITQNGSPNFVAEINRIAEEKYDMRRIKIRHSLAGYESQKYTALIADAERQISNLDGEIRELLKNLADYNKERNDLLARRCGYEVMKNNNGSNEMMEFFLANDSLVLDNVYGTRIDFGVKTYVTDYNPDLLEDVLDTQGSWVQYTNDNIRYLLRKLFVEQAGKLKMCGKFRYENMRVSVKTSDEIKLGPEYDQCVPNPHLFYFGCLGDNSYIIQQYLANGQEVEAITQLIVATGNLNFSDFTVMKRFVQLFEMVYDTRECVEYQGEVMTPEEFVSRMRRMEDA